VSDGNRGKTADIGILGLGVMGCNMALNLADHGWQVAATDPWPEARDRLRRALPAEDASSRVVEDTATLVATLKRPRQLLMMVKAGEPVDAALAELQPLLTAGDCVMDGGNSHFRDTRRRCRTLAEQGISLLDLGISGGAAGARRGPAIMVGGAEEAYRRAAPLLRTIAARHGLEPCCARFGEEGAGHFVKMVHNSIEYAAMQVIAEVYAAMQALLGLSYPQMSACLRDWNRGLGASYLLKITAEILDRRDPETGRPLPELVLDTPGQKGTGQWAAQTALELGVAAPTLIEAVQARTLAADRAQRLARAGRWPGPLGESAAELTEGDLQDALLAGTLSAYAQGFALLQAAAAEYGWAAPVAKAAAVWRAGCIIRAEVLQLATDALATAPQDSALLDIAPLREAMASAQVGWRRTAAAAAVAGLPLPALAASLAWYDGSRSARLPANLIQCQRDYFGAHGYRRIDRSGDFHTDWSAPDSDSDRSP